MSQFYHGHFLFLQSAHPPPPYSVTNMSQLHYGHIQILSLHTSPLHHDHILTVSYTLLNHLTCLIICFYHEQVSIQTQLLPIQPLLSSSNSITGMFHFSHVNLSTRSWPGHTSTHCNMTIHLRSDPTLRYSTVLQQACHSTQFYHGHLQTLTTNFTKEETLLLQSTHTSTRGKIYFN